MAGSIPKTGNITKEAQTKSRFPQRTAKTTARKPAAKRTPGKAVAKIVGPKPLDTDLSPAKAKSITKKIAESADATLDLLVQAWNGRVWIGTGHKNWDEWRAGSFEDYPLALPLLQRKAAVVKLVEAKMSTRAIKELTGTGQQTAQRDVEDAKAAMNGDVTQSESDTEPQIGDDGEVIEGEVVSEDEQPNTVINRATGAEVTVKPKQPKAPVVVNIVSDARAVGKALEKVTISLQSLYDRDDYDENMIDVDKTLETAISDFVDVVGERLPERVSA